MIKKQYDFLRLKKSSYFPTHYNSVSTIFLNCIEPTDYTYYTTCTEREDPRLVFENSHKLNYPFYTFYWAPERKMVAMNIEGDIEDKKIRTKDTKVRLNIRRKVKMIQNLFNVSKEKIKEL